MFGGLLGGILGMILGAPRRRTTVRADEAGWRVPAVFRGAPCYKQDSDFT